MLRDLGERATAYGVGVASARAASLMLNVIPA
jgi:hypothetical protein